MNYRPIAVFDSGIGGLPYLQALQALLPDEDYIYLADREGFPYGRKTRDEVKLRTCSCLDRLVARFNPKMIVIACNTASQASLSAVRSRHPDIPVVGTVPAVKPAAQSTRTGTIAVLSTNRAAEDPYLDGLITRHAQGVNVVRAGAQELVDFVEKKFLDASMRKRLAACNAAIEPIRGSGADHIVLACTHFLHVAACIAEAAGPSVRIVDSREGVARQAARLLKDSGNPGTPGRENRSMYATGAPEAWENLSRFAERYSLEFLGTL